MTCPKVPYPTLRDAWIASLGLLRLSRRLGASRVRERQKDYKTQLDSGSLILSTPITSLNPNHYV